ncbi:MAG: POTRA domain-containing protein [Bacteroidota bacterium]
MSNKVHHRLHHLMPFVMMVFLTAGWFSAKAQHENDGQKKYIIRNISFKGNKISRDRIIARELMLTEGDTLSVSEMETLLEKSRENLMNTSLFNFVTTSVSEDQENPLVADIQFTLTERWYIWPWPIIEFADKNFNTWWQENRDLSRMSYGIVLRWENFRGRKELLELTSRFGYLEEYGLDYTIPYLNKKETLGIGIGAAFGRTREVPVRNVDNKIEYYQDDADYVIKGVSSYISINYRRHIYNTHAVRLKYTWQNFQDTLLSINPHFSVGGLTTLRYFSFSYLYKNDHRDYKPYPLKGHYFDFEVVKNGFGVFDNGGLDAFYILTTFRRYVQLAGRLYFASGLNAKFSNNAQQPYLMNGAIGYGRDIVRGYEYYMVHGSNYGIFKNNLKFALMPTREHNIDFIRSEKFGKVHYAFYLNAFLDLGFADNINPQPEANNDLENALLVGYGLGLDFVTYYDLVFRFEYSFNRMKEHGFFLHFMAPI